MSTIPPPARGGAQAADWPSLLRLIPGYDPFAQAAGCWFDERAADIALRFFPAFITHVEGALAGQPFELELWQQAIIANLFGWKKKDQAGREVRRYRELFLFVPRKNGKSPLAAALALYCFFIDDEAGQQDYIAAKDREQAGILFRQAQAMIRNAPALAKRCKVYGGNAAGGQSKSIVREKDNSYLKVISADADSKHGGNTHLAIIDELHVQPNRDLVDVLQTSMASENRKQPLFVNITTAGHDRTSICYEKYTYAGKVRDNGGDENKPGYDPSFLPVIYEAGQDDDWTDEATWRKANPNLGVSVSLDYLRRECKRAQETPDYENTFKQLHLNLWTQQAVKWLSMHRWEQSGNKRPFTIDELRGRDCYGGLDLASTKDTTAFVLVFPIDNGFALLPRIWVPESAVVERTRAHSTARYDAWVRNGFMIQTEGNWCDYTVVEHDILEWAGMFNIKSIAFDPREGAMLATRLIGAGVEMEKFEQSFTNYNEPCKFFEQLIGEDRLWHNNHPVLYWMAGNVALDKNVALLRLPSKRKSQDKIDGITAAIMGLAKAMSNPAEADWYTPGCLRD